MDIELMRRLSPRVNVIPVIGKADSLTPRELKAFKKRVCWILQTPHSSFHYFIQCQIMEDIDHYEIPIYNFPYDVEEDDEETIADNMELRVSHYIRTRHAAHFLIPFRHRLYFLSLL